MIIQDRTNNCIDNYKIQIFGKLDGNICVWKWRKQIETCDIVCVASTNPWKRNKVQKWFAILCHFFFSWHRLRTSSEEWFQLLLFCRLFVVQKSSISVPQLLDILYSYGICQILQCYNSWYVNIRDKSNHLEFGERQITHRSLFLKKSIKNMIFVKRTNTRGKKRIWCLWNFFSPQRAL